VQDVAEREGPETTSKSIDSQTGSLRVNSSDMPTTEFPAVDYEVGDPAAPLESEPHRSPRGDDVALKQQRVAEFLEDEGYDAVLLSRQDSFAWITAGGDSSAGVAGDVGNVSVFLTRDQRCILATNAESGRTFEEEVAGLGFQLKECRWDEPRDRLVEDICRGRRTASDTGICGTTNELDKLRRLRINLTDLERERYRELGRAVAHAVEATCRNARPGETEHDVAGELSHRLIRHGIAPVTMFVAGEERTAQFRTVPHKAQPIRRWLTITACGRRHGLCASVTRTVAFHAAERELVEQHHRAAMIDATYIYFSQPGEQAAEVLKRARRIYEKIGRAHEWLLAPQGGVTGYSPCEVVVVPNCPLRLRAGMAVAWTPSVGPARSGDSVMLHENGYEILTPTQQWPFLTISVKGFEVERPGVLVLDV
jgi:Xaa-Pro aminopeptidase